MTSSQTVPIGATSARSEPAEQRILSSGQWRGRYARLLAIVDFVVIVWAVVGAYVLRIGLERRSVSIGDRVLAPDVPVTYFGVSVAIIVLWWTALAVADSRQPRILGVGADEYKRIFQASFAVFGGVAIVGYLTTASIARGFLAVAFPAGLVGLLIARALCRELLRTRRRAGFASSRCVVIGSELHVRHLIAELQSRTDTGYVVVGACVDGGQPESGDTLLGVPLLGSSRSATQHLQSVTANALIVAPSDTLGPEQLQKFGWEIEDRDVELIMSPSLINVAGPRIHMRPVAGLPLIHVEDPRLPRSGALVKGAFDKLGSLALILALSPVLIGVALAVRLTSPGPALFTQERIGENGEPFKVFKFRSMIVNADDQLKALLAAQGGGDKPLFKPENDPRITKIGHFIRKYSLDELPQLFNVLFGTMSLVGPRPQRQAEVDLYTGGAERRLLCKPGMTGLWQVSGRSDMPWEKAMRLDLYYVENWSFTFDLLLLWRTIGVVVNGSGAR